MTANVLIVDDLEQNIRLLEAKLLREYYTVYCASDGQRALEALQEHKIDVILLDGMMPGLDGFNTCKAIKANPDTMHIPVVMVTALSDIEDRIRGLEAGADEFLTKPVDDIALFARVRSLSRIKTVIDELKLRNQTNAELGGTIIDFVDNFIDNDIIIIDDDIIQAKNIAKTLTNLTLHIKTLNHIEKIEEVISGCIPDIVIISCQMEYADPLRIASKLRAIEELKHSSIMFLSEEENMPMVMRGLELGVNDYFLYPVDENELLARIRTQLRRKKYQDALRHDLEQSVNLAIKDGLTGIFNRRYFDMHIAQMAIKAISTSTTFYLLMVDIDDFKHVNDQYGHCVGDEVLKKVTDALKEQLRITDFIARYGGEEFAIVLSDMSSDCAYAVAERLRCLIESTEFNIAGMQPMHKTISIGIAQYNKMELITNLIERADKALYSAKESGRNKVVLAVSAT